MLFLKRQCPISNFIVHFWRFCAEMIIDVTESSVDRTTYYIYGRLSKTDYNLLFQLTYTCSCMHFPFFNSINPNKTVVWNKQCMSYLSKKGVTPVQANSNKIGSWETTSILLTRLRTQPCATPLVDECRVGTWFAEVWFKMTKVAFKLPILAFNFYEMDPSLKNLCQFLNRYCWKLKRKDS